MEHTLYRISYNKILQLINILTITSIAAIAADSLAHEGNSESISATDARISVMGRTLTGEDGSRSFAYPGVTFQLAYEARELLLDAGSTRDETYIEVIVDNGAPRKILLKPKPESIRLVHDDKITKHTVKIIRRNEIWHGIATFKKFTVRSGHFLPAPELPQRKLLFMGDSATCSEGVDRNPTNKKDPSVWNPRESFGFLVANHLNAQVHLICMSGYGMTEVWNNKPEELRLPQFFERTISSIAIKAPWDHTQYAADAIINTIGVTDFDLAIPDEKTYRATYVNFVLSVLAKYPKAQVFLSEGPVISGEKKSIMIDYLQRIIQQVNNPRVHYLAISHQPGDSYDAHPNKEQHQEIATGISANLRHYLGW